MQLCRYYIEQIKRLSLKYIEANDVQVQQMITLSLQNNRQLLIARAEGLGLKVDLSLLEEPYQKSNEPIYMANHIQYLDELLEQLQQQADSTIHIQQGHDVNEPVDEIENTLPSTEHFISPTESQILLSEIYHVYKHILLNILTHSVTPQEQQQLATIMYQLYEQHGILSEQHWLQWQKQRYSTDEQAYQMLLIDIEQSLGQYLHEFSVD